jgi:hypothetical protein
MTLVNGQPPDGTVWLDDGHNHGYVPVTAHDRDEVVAINEFHRAGDGWCYGFVAFRSYSPEHGWDVLSMDPLTLSPSLLCRACGNHGFIRDGVWVAA